MNKKLLLTFFLLLGLQSVLYAQQCGGRFNDPAGPNANYTNNMDYTVTIYPTNPGEIVTVTFTSFGVEDEWDALYVFDGNSTAAPQIRSTNPSGNVPGGLSGGYWGTGIPGPFTSSSIDGSLTFRFRTDNSGVDIGWIANITCSMGPSCRKPGGVTSTLLSSTSASITWTEIGTATTWDTYLTVAGEPAPTDTSDEFNTISSNPTTFNGLTPNTCYTFYVRSHCSETEKSEWTSGFNFCTPMLPPSCGGQFVDNGGANANYNNNSDVTTTICPTIPGDLVKVTFLSFNTETNYDALYVFNGNSINSPLLASANGAGQVPGGLAGGYWGTVVPGPFTSSSLDGCLTFRFRSDNSGQRAGWVANITCAPPPTCPKPTNLSANAITATTANLGWIGNSTATQWEILVLPVGSPAPTPTTSGTSVLTNPTTASLVPSTCYTYYVRGVCSDTDKSEWSVGFNFCTLAAPPICGGNFVDNGGPNLPYTNNLDTTTTICPSNPNEIVTVVFTSFQVEPDYDALYVFDGNSIAAPLLASSNTAGNVPGGLAGGFWGTTIPGPFTSTSPDGCLTFRFRTDNSEQRAGWVANITCAPDADKIVLVAFVDSNTNGIKDSGESLFPSGNFIYQQNSNGTDVYGYSPSGQFALYDTNAANTYSFSYQVQAGYAPYYNSGTTTYNNISVTPGSGAQFLYFPVTRTQTYNDVSVSLSPITAPRPGFTYVNRITYKNLGIASTSGTITFVKPPQITAVAVSQGGTVNNASGFTYTFANLMPNETRTFLVTMTVPSVPIVNINQLLTSTVSITAPSGDIDTTNNSNESSQIVVNSWDPNDKMESRGKTIPFNQFAPDDYFFYTIRFQNNGTANAIDVRIEDLLNASKIDETSVLMVSSSHNYTMKRINNQLVWDFKNIFLTPFSVNENASRGYVQFKVKLKPGFQAGDIISNSASIFFDSNPAIVTAVFNTKFTVPLNISDFDENSFVLYPNPANDSVRIDVINTDEQLEKVVFYNLLGKSVKTINSVATSSIIVDVSDMAKGVYLVEITSDTNLKLTKKLIVQ